MEATTIVKITQAELETAEFTDVRLNAKANTSFDNKAKKAGESATVKHTFDLDSVTVKEALEDALVKTLVIKANSRMKQHAATSSNYLDYLSDNKHTFNWTFDELMERRPGGITDPTVRASKATQQMSAEELAEFLANAQARLAELQQAGE